MSIGDFPETLSQAILVGIMLVGRLGVIKCHSVTKLYIIRYHSVTNPEMLYT